MAEKVWPTPVTADSGEKTTLVTHQHASLMREAVFWATPSVASATGGQANRGQDRQDELLLAGQARDVCSRLDPTTSTDGPDTSASGLTLNPRFVEALMGWPTGWTDFACSETALFRFRRRMRSALSQLASPPAAPPAQPSLFG